MTMLLAYLEASLTGV